MPKKNREEEKQDKVLNKDRRILIEFVATMNNFYPPRHQVESKSKTQTERLNQIQSRVWLIGAIGFISSGWLFYSLFLKRNRPSVLDLVAIVITIYTFHKMQDLMQKDMSLRYETNQSLSKLLSCIDNLSDKTRQLLFQAAYFKDYKKIIVSDIETVLGSVWMHSVNAVQSLQFHPDFIKKYKIQVKLAIENAVLIRRENLKWDINKGRIITKKTKINTPKANLINTASTQQPSLKPETKLENICKDNNQKDPSSKSETNSSQQQQYFVSSEPQNRSIKVPKFKSTHIRSIFKSVKQNLQLLPQPKWSHPKTNNPKTTVEETSEIIPKFHPRKWLESTMKLEKIAKENHIISIETGSKEAKNTILDHLQFQAETAKSLRYTLLQLHDIECFDTDINPFNDSYNPNQYLVSLKDKNLPDLLWDYIFIERNLVSLSNCHSLINAVDKDFEIFFQKLMINVDYERRESKNSSENTMLQPHFIKFIQNPFVKYLLNDIFATGSVSALDKIRETNDVLLNQFLIPNHNFMISKLQNYLTTTIIEAYLQKRDLIERFLPWIAVIVVITAPSTIHDIKNFGNAIHDFLDDTPLFNCIFFKDGKALSHAEKNDIFKNLFQKLQQELMPIISPFWNNAYKNHQIHPTQGMMNSFRY